MNENFQIFSILCTILIQTSEIKAQTARCVYSSQYFWTAGYTTTNESFYACSLDTRRSNFNKKVMRIEGQHLIDQHEDSDVKYITNYIESKLRVFSSIFCNQFPNLEVIAIKSATIESIEPNSLQNCKHLKTLMA
ncbi:hypothetical protein ACKWTF_015285 [Chironomus riparius]